MQPPRLAVADHHDGDDVRFKGVATFSVGSTKHACNDEYDGVLDLAAWGTNQVLGWKV